MPYGLVNAPSVSLVFYKLWFARVLLYFLHSRVIIYIDGTLISKTEAEHTAQVQVMLKRLLENNSLEWKFSQSFSLL